MKKLLKTTAICVLGLSCFFTLDAGMGNQRHGMNTPGVSQPQQSVEQLAAITITRGFYLAIEYGETDAAAELLGAFPELAAHRLTSGKTPLHFAVRQGHLSIAQMLLNAGANPRIEDNEGLTPFGVAVDAIQQEYSSARDASESAYNMLGLFMTNQNGITDFEVILYSTLCLQFSMLRDNLEKHPANWQHGIRAHLNILQFLRDNGYVQHSGLQAMFEALQRLSRGLR